MEYKCSVCQERIEGDMIRYMDHTEKHVVDLVKHDHPEWIQEDGLCQKCVDYYKAELSGTVFGDAPCAIRNRKIKGVLGAFKNIFKGKN